MLLSAKLPHFFVHGVASACLNLWQHKKQRSNHCPLAQVGKLWLPQVAVLQPKGFTQLSSCSLWCRRRRHKWPGLLQMSWTSLVAIGAGEIHQLAGSASLLASTGYIELIKKILIALKFMQCLIQLASFEAAQIPNSLLEKKRGACAYIWEGERGKTNALN